jgi:hypothetical protein
MNNLETDTIDMTKTHPDPDLALSIIHLALKKPSHQPSKSTKSTIQAQAQV